MGPNGSKKEHAIKWPKKVSWYFGKMSIKQLLVFYNSLSDILKIVKQKLLVNSMTFIKNTQNNFSLFIIL